MREHGVKVLTVRDILSYGVEDHVGARVELEDLAMKVRVTPLMQQSRYTALGAQTPAQPLRSAMTSPMHLGAAW